ncbi:hypothetical protein GCM10022214_01650 [Actinomadura miaoliensis]|uniref:Uncharacterized protein n=1 Tax=Actinomadura miaoliensis TaxID=430685 RepID=A0ABP7UWG7_9ACTN
MICGPGGSAARLGVGIFGMTPVGTGARRAALFSRCSVALVSSVKCVPQNAAGNANARTMTATLNTVTRPVVGIGLEAGPSIRYRMDELPEVIGSAPGPSVSLSYIRPFVAQRRYLVAAP